MRIHCFPAVIVLLLVLIENAVSWTGNVCSVQVCAYRWERRCYYRTWNGCCGYRWYWVPYWRTDNFCCPGWTTRTDENCNKAICNPKCISSQGSCTAPNTCSCVSPFQGPLCDGNATCSYFDPCYPGACNSNSDCTCSDGFGGSECRVFMDDKFVPTINRCNATFTYHSRQKGMDIYSYFGDATDLTEPYVLWTNQQDFNILEMTMEAIYDTEYNIQQALPPKPDYVHSLKLGIVDAKVLTRHTKISGSAPYVELFKCSQPSKDNPILNELMVCMLNGTNDIRVDSGDKLTLKFTVTSGGVIRYQNKNNPNVITETRYYTGKTAENTVEFRFDHMEPTHCITDQTPCSDHPLHLDKDITKESIKPTWKGWTDALSGVFKYSVELWKMEFSLDYKHLREPLITATSNPVPLFIEEIINITELLQFPVFIPPEPGIYSCILEVSDEANNTRYARRFVIYDKTSQVTVRDDNPLYCMSASESSGYKWQTNINNDINGKTRVDISWADHFVNEVHEAGHFLSPVGQYEPRLTDGGRRVDYKKIEEAFDDFEGERQRSVIENVNSIVKFEFAHQIPPVDLANIAWSTIPGLKQNISLTLSGVNDGYVHEFFVRATDIMGNQKIDSTTIIFDSTIPSLGEPELDYNVQDGFYDFSSRFTIVSRDDQSGVPIVKVKIVTKNGTTKYEHTYNNTPVADGNCDSCYCTPKQGDCYKSNMTFDINNCWMGVAIDDIETEMHRLEIVAYNGAMLSHMKTVDILDVGNLTGFQKYESVDNLEIVSISDTTVRIKWDHPKSCYIRLGINLVLTFGNNLTLEFKIYKDATSFDITGLHPFTSYSFQLFTKYGTDDNFVMSEPVTMSMTTTAKTSFPNSMVSPTVESVLIDGPAYQIPNVESTPSLLPVFKCNFDDIPHVTYVYDVYWYINGNNVTSYKNISYSNISTTVLRGSDWTHSYNMNMKVQCSVRLRYFVGSVPGPFIQSQVFAAGLYPENYEYRVIEGEFINIAFTSTVPIGCISSHNDFMPHCSQSIYIFQPKHDDMRYSCLNNIASKDIVFKAEFCGIKLTTLDWNETKYLKIYGFSDGIYNQEDRSTYIQLSTANITTLSDIWKDIQIPDIKVTVIDKDSVLNNRLCQSYNDPHITTFDGKLYHYMEVGEFVMYRNDKGPFWVHSLFTNCGFGWQGSSCHCGIAIRSRNSLFVLRTCETISRNDKHLLQQPITELKSCDDSDMLIDQYGNEYKVTLPIGTEIRFRVSTSTKFITMISVKPSIYDINEAKGLCGVPSTTKDTSDDFTHRQSGPVNDYKTFADSWRITSVMTSEKLFIAEPEFLNNQVIEIDDTVDSGDNITSYCVCERQAGSSNDLDDFNTVQCNLTESTLYCSGSSQSTEETSGTIYTSCSYHKENYVGSSHTTESSSDSDDVLEFKPLIYDDDVDNTDEVVPNTFRNGWNESNAYQKCLESIRKALPTDLYTDVVDLQEEYFIQSCVKDIELVGDLTFLPDTIGTMMTFIITEVRRNESLYTMKTSNGSQTVLEYISSFLCPNNCSGNGNCTSGVCSCYDGFTGNDCSQEISTPPSGISLPSNGLCTLGTRKCKRTNVYGDFQSTTVWYQLKYFQILKDTQVFASDVEILEAKYRHMFMVSVELPSSRRKRDTSDTALAYGYEINLSNDRLNFGESVNIIMYDESCYTCNSTSVTCTVLESCLESSEKVTNDNWKFVAIGGTLGVVAAILLVIGLIYFISKNSKKEIKVVGENKEDTTFSDHEMTFSNSGMPKENTFKEDTTYTDHEMTFSNIGMPKENTVSNL